MKSKYIKLVEDVLSKKKSHLTVAQIWETARNEGYLVGVDYGNSPEKAITLSINLYIRRYRDSSDIVSTADIPKKYYLRSSIVDLNGDLFVYHDEADKLLKKLERYSFAEKMEILSGKIKSRKSVKTEFKNGDVKRPIRDINVIAFVRLRSGFTCECCRWYGFKKKNGAIYIEVHHLQMLAENGADIPENAVALCPNCHREMHHSENREELMQEVIRKLEAKGIFVSPTLSISQTASILEV